jgi:hypothetical protein
VLSAHFDVHGIINGFPTLLRILYMIISRRNVRVGKPFIIPCSQEGDLSDRYEFRIDQSLKEWIKVNGGGAFVRTVLRREQAKQGQYHEDVTVQMPSMYGPR